MEGVHVGGNFEWGKPRNLVKGDGLFHYPAIIEDDGHLHVTFTNNRRWIDHIQISKDWPSGAGEDLPDWVDKGKVRS